MSDSNSSSLSIKAAGANDSGRYTVTITNDLGTDLHSANLTVEGETTLKSLVGLSVFFLHCRKRENVVIVNVVIALLLNDDYD